MELKDALDCLGQTVGCLATLVSLPFTGVICWGLLGPPTNCGAVMGWVVIYPLAETFVMMVVWGAFMALMMPIAMTVELLSPNDRDA